jgi:hypothetical protein
MTKPTRVRLFLALMLLGVVAGIVATPATEVAVAAPPCEICDSRLEECYAGTLWPSCNGDPACCWNQVASCYAWCY